MLRGTVRRFTDAIHDLEFDLAVTVSSSSSSKAGGKAGIKVVEVYTGSLGAEAESSGKHEVVSRIRFKIPVRYPLQKLGKPDWETRVTNAKPHA